MYKREKRCRSRKRSAFLLWEMETGDFAERKTITDFEYSKSVIVCVASILIYLQENIITILMSNLHDFYNIISKFVEK